MRIKRFLPLVLLLVFSISIAKANTTKLDSEIVLNGKIQSLIVEFETPKTEISDNTDVWENLKSEANAHEELLKQLGLKAHCFAAARNCQIWAQATEKNLQVLSQINEVMWIHENTVYQLPPMDVQNAEQPQDVTWGLTAMQVPEAWEYTIGSNNVIGATTDTGVDYNHPNLSANFFGADGWFDAIKGQPIPYDDYGHGTHTMGTFVGQNGIGVAPGLKWISAKVCNEYGGCPTDSILSAGDWLVEFAVQHPDKRIVVSNSWGGYAGNTQYHTFDNMIATWLDFGIFPVFSAGNEGPFCESSGSPAGDSGSQIGVGATTEEGNIAIWSSRGPDAYGNNFPEISAPGENVISAWPGGSLVSLSGTSMASPHVAGELGLMLSLDMTLTWEEASEVLFSSAISPLYEDPCGNWENNEGGNSFGYGIANAYQALSQLAAFDTTLSGTVTNTETGKGIKNATLVFSSATYGTTIQTNADGGFAVNLVSGTYEITISKFAYENSVETLTITVGENSQNFDLAPMPLYSLEGTILSQNYPTDATITITNGAPETPPIDEYTIQTNSGKYYMELPWGIYDFHVENPICEGSFYTELFFDYSYDYQIPDWIEYQVTIDTRDFLQASSQIYNGCDDCYFEYDLNIAHSIKFYDKYINHLRISSNGYILMGTPAEVPGPVNTWLPTQAPSMETFNMVAPYWVDLDLTQEGYVSVEETSIGVIIEWFGPNYWVDGYSHFSVRIKWNGDIDSYYGEIVTDDVNQNQIQIQGDRMDRFTYVQGNFNLPPQDGSVFIWNRTTHPCMFTWQRIYLPMITR